MAHGITNRCAAGSGRAEKGPVGNGGDDGATDGSAFSPAPVSLCPEGDVGEEPSRDDAARTRVGEVVGGHPGGEQRVWGSRGLMWEADTAARTG